MLHTIIHHPLVAKLRSACCLETGLLIMRLVVGAVMVYHGYPKLFGGTEMTIGFFAKIGIPFPAFFAVFVGTVEFFGGLALMLGLAARLVGLAFIVDMAVAILAAKGLASWRGIELELLLLAGGALALLAGAGRYSLDALVMKTVSKAHDAAMPVPKA